MKRMVRDFIEVRDGLTLDGLIGRLAELRLSLPVGVDDVQVRMRGDDVFGRHLSVSFMRPQTDEEEALDARYLAVAEGYPKAA